MSRDFHLPGRSPVIAGEGMAATSHPLATLAAIDVLRAGGNAADAAITAAAVLCVIEPHMTGIGGDCFALIAQNGKPVWGYNGCGRSGAKSSTEALLAKGIKTIEATSPHAVNVPGAIEAWDAILKAQGNWPLDRVLAPAIKYAEHGFPVAPRVASDWKGLVGKLGNSAGATRHYLPGGRAPAEGDVVKLPALAETLKAIAKNGPRAFYEGPIADDMAATLAAAGSVLTAEDFAKHRGEAVTPISTNYRGIDLVEIPPNTQGLTALVTLNILENFDLASLDALGPDRFHLMLEAARLGFAVRDTHIAEPSHMRVTVEALNDKAFAKKLAAKLDRSKRVPLPAAPAPGSDTIYLTVVDRDRRAVSLINSLFSSFGSAHLHREDRRPVQQPRLGLRAQSGPSERARSEQAADAHHHSGAGDARRPLRHDLRRDGRALSADGPRADGAQHVRLRHGHPERDRRAARVLRRRRHRGRARHAGGHCRGARIARPQGRDRSRRPGVARRRSASTGTAAC